jgi:hypothetical protein
MYWRTSDSIGSWISLPVGYSQPLHHQLLQAYTGPFIDSLEHIDCFSHNVLVHRNHDEVWSLSVRTYSSFDSFTRWTNPLGLNNVRCFIYAHSLAFHFVLRNNFWTGRWGMLYGTIAIMQ